MQDRKRPAGALTCGAFLCLLLAGSLARAELFLTRNQNPFSLFQGQPLPLPAQAPPAGWRAGLSLDISNTLNAPSNSNQSLYVDYEAYVLNVRISKTLTDRWYLITDVPLVHRGGGMFDRAIDNWHRAFGLPRADRPNVADNQFAIRYVRDGATRIDLNRTTTGVGDIGLNLGYQLQTNTAAKLALWLGMELPAGDSSRLTGNEQLDVSLSLAASLRPSPDWRLDFNLGVVRPGGNLIDANPVADTVFYSYLSGRWQLLDWLQLGLQLESHQAYYRDASLDLMDNANVLVFGGAIVFGPCEQLDIGFSEDIAVGSSPDIALLLNWRQRAC